MKRKSSKIGLMVTAMLLGIAVPVFAQDVLVESENSEVGAIEAQEIKASKETLEKANSAIARKDYQSAIVYLSAYLNYKNKKYEIYKLRGECFYALRQYGLAEKDFQTAIDLKTADDKFITGTKVLSAVVLGADKQEQYQNPELGNLYGELMYAQKAQNKQAYETSFQKAGEYNSHIYLPTPKVSEINKINCPQKYGKPFNPQGMDATIYGAIDDIADKNYRDAVFKIQEITSEYPKYYLGYYLSGVAMVGLEQEDDAIDAFNQALKYNPYDFESMASLGQIYYNRAEKTFNSDDATKSLDYFNKALKYNSNCPTYYFYAGLNQMLLKDYEKATQEFNSAIAKNPADYGSMYYKAISQYVTGDYDAVISGTTSLLYKRVSNYNSVLYLKALAEYKSEKTNDALADLEKIHNSIDNIYSDEIKINSKKDELLDSYLYYLKSQILKDKGYGVVSDLHKAYQNPVIAALAKDEDVVFNMPAEDIENQYDYMQTTFADKNIKISYQNPDYRISTSKGLPVEDNQKTAFVEDEIQDVEFVPQKEDEQTAPELSLKQNDDIIASTNEMSIAQMLASNTFPQFPKVEEEVKSEEIQPNIQEEKIEPQIQVEQEKIAENVQDIKDTESEQDDNQFIIIDEDTIVFTAPVQKQVESFDIKYEAPKVEIPQEQKVEAPQEILVETPQSEVVENNSNSIKIVAPEIKESEDFVISYNNLDEKLSGLTPKTDEVDAEVVSNADEFINPSEESVSEVVPEVKEIVPEMPIEPQKTVAETIPAVENVVQIPEEQAPQVSGEVIAQLPVLRTEKAQIEDEVVPQKAENVVVEKHADVNLDDFSLPQNKVLEIKADDEVIVFNPKTLHTPTLKQEGFSSDFAKIRNRNVQQEEILSSQEAQNDYEEQGQTEIVVSNGVELITKEENENKSEPEIANDVSKTEQIEQVEQPEQPSLLAQEVEDNVKNFTEADLTVAALPDMPYEISEPEIPEIETSKVKKEKRHWFKKKEKVLVDETSQMQDETSSEKTLSEFLANSSDENISETKKAKKAKKVKKDKTLSDILVNSEPEVVEEVYNEPVEDETTVEKKKFKLFGKKNKKVSDVESVVDVADEEVIQQPIENENDEVQEVKTEKKKFSWFKRNKKSEEVNTELEGSELLPVEEVKSGSPFDYENDVEVEDETLTTENNEINVDKKSRKFFNRKGSKSRSNAEKDRKSFWKRIFSKKTVEIQEETSNEE